MGELARLAPHRLAIDDVIAEELVLGSLQLSLANRLAAQLVELRDERFLDLIVRPSRRNERDSEKQIRLLDDVAAPECRERDLLLIDERLIDA